MNTYWQVETVNNVVSSHYPSVQCSYYMTWSA